ncbi:MAG: hypothetical protein WC657_08355 [Candidatus Paceibacterota bacterium]
MKRFPVSPSSRLPRAARKEDIPAACSPKPMLSGQDFSVMTKGGSLPRSARGLHQRKRHSKGYRTTKEKMRTERWTESPCLRHFWHFACGAGSDAKSKW